MSHSVLAFLVSVVIEMQIELDMYEIIKVSASNTIQGKDKMRIQNTVSRAWWQVKKASRENPTQDLMLASPFPRRVLSL